MSSSGCLQVSKTAQRRARSYLEFLAPLLNRSPVVLLVVHRQIPEPNGTLFVLDSHGPLEFRVTRKYKRAQVAERIARPIERQSLAKRVLERERDITTMITIDANDQIVK